MAEDHSSHSHSGGITLTSIPLLEKQLDWEEWIRKGEGWLAHHDYDEPEPIAPGRTQTRNTAAATDAADLYSKAHANWAKGQKKAITGLKSRCGTRAYKICKDIHTLDKLLETLKAEFKPKGESVFNDIYNRWENVHLGACEDVNDYCTQFDQIRTELTDIDPECKLPRPILIKKFIQGLGPAFNTWEMSFNQQHSIIGNNGKPGVTLLETQSSARVEEQRLKGNNTTIGMLATNANGKRPRQANGPATPGGRWCYTCKHSGHWDPECWFQHPELRLIWEAENPEKAARRNAKSHGKRARTGKPTEGTTPLPPPATTSAHAAIAVRTTNLF
jgi:hypothetical protein